MRKVVHVLSRVDIYVVCSSGEQSFIFIIFVTVPPRKSTTF